jgi:ubiquinone/menaquinone biosynthesis C-methylase UbiE
MSLTDRLNCPECQGRLTSAFSHELVCSVCDRGFAITDGIVDLVGGRSPSGSELYRGVTQRHGFLAADLVVRIKNAAGNLWPPSLGDTIELGCGDGATTQAILTHETVRSVLVADTDPAILQACRTRVAELVPGLPLWFAALGGDLVTIRDAVADTVIGTAVLAQVGDIRGFITRIHRMLKPRGRAMFVVPNRRYHQAVSMAIAEALTQRYTRAGAWPEASGPVFAMLGEMRRMLLHRGDPGLSGGTDETRLFDADALEDIARETGFGSVEVLPLDPDPIGGQTITRLCQEAGVQTEFAQEFGPLAATIGRPYLSLLCQQDASAFNLVWLTKAAGPEVRFFTGRPTGLPMVYVGPDAAVGGMMPRWSVELLGRDTPEGVIVTVGGWCLANIDALWVRVTLDSVSRQAAVWHPRPDVHEVLNRGHIYHPAHAICSGLRDTMLFAGVHPADEGCLLRVEIVLSGGFVVTGPAPEWLIMDQPAVIAH